MKSIDPNDLSIKENYKFLTGSIIPRPIAFVTTLSTDGVLNAAPFSYFNALTSNPPLIAISIGRKNGIQKDTSRNAEALGEFVVHIPDESYIEAVNLTAANLSPDESEVDLAKLTPVDSVKIKVPGLAEAKIRMECVVEQILPLGGTPDQPATDLLIGKVVHYHIAEDLYSSGRIDAEKLRPVGRLAGTNYVKLGETLSLERPE
ncbi:flavin reductase family protein [Fictibacillus phosphorivorans]|uniref:flavin reductase family protein n=1 Tax=Fictibacillus phosphorivorans TaxID=1221500 RepID=UPI00203DC8A0|nr:flavin reductase family protein [Fictibacillus phosphorivorans]MCM3717353.1 flavin reductase family protein [Fictibacillus phosphorivorans]MCM3775048.1 flavin reductase family protein [Fictibacillus phosphorivorans]